MPARSKLTPAQALEASQWAARKPVEDTRPDKQVVTLMLDEDIMAFHHAGGSGWQERINAILKDHMQMQKPRVR